MIDLQAVASDIEPCIAALLDSSQRKQLKAALEHCLFDPISLADGSNFGQDCAQPSTAY